MYVNMAKNLTKFIHNTNSTTILWMYGKITTQFTIIFFFTISHISGVGNKIKHSFKKNKIK